MRVWADERKSEAKQLMAQAWWVNAFSRMKRLPRLQNVIQRLDARGEKPKDAKHLVSQLKLAFGVTEDG